MYDNRILSDGSSYVLAIPFIITFFVSDAQYRPYTYESINPVGALIERPRRNRFLFCNNTGEKEFKIYETVYFFKHLAGGQ